MSLINEALKKAQRVRTGDTVGSLASMPGGGSRVAKEGARDGAPERPVISSSADERTPGHTSAARTQKR